ncbi:MAG: MBL fold hydrolase [Planctomycetota bacterium]|nr:MAG: MBL fold hydrolase [Planctomycetota bacterium]
MGRPGQRPRLRCYGAVRTVTGSRHLLEANGDRVLLDCGLFQGRRAESRRKNRELPFDPRTITTVVLSHAHIDHCGNLPQLVAQGFRGEIVCTAATADLAGILLEDSAFIQQKDAEYYNRRALERGSDDRIEPLYRIEDVWATIDRFRTVPYHYETEVARGVRAVFRDAGHILGSASVGLTVELPGGGARRLTFSGDIGRKLMPILRDPEPLVPADLILCESTYGDRLHPPAGEQKQVLARVIGEAAARGGKVIVPAFSVGRTQNLVYFLHELFLEGRLPRLPIFVDSPLSSRATLVYRAHPECYDEPTKDTFLSAGHDPLGFRDLTYITSVERSMELNTLEGPAVIIAASGMCEAGRILHHLKHHVGDPRTTVLIVGFQAEHTLGRKLLEGAERIKVYGEEVPVRCRVVAMQGLSAHADRDGLLQLFRQLPEPRGQRALLVHGEPPQSEALAEHLGALGVEARLPVEGEPYEL